MDNLPVKNMPIHIDNSRLLLIAGPCMIESRDMALQVADHLLRVTEALPVQLVFKGSYRKANRTSADSVQGIGDEAALAVLAEVGERYGIPTLTDIHADAEAALAAQYVDVLQIPAFLCRQTSLLEAAARTGCTVNIKKGQFLAPDDMAKAAAKVTRCGNSSVWLTERGTTFGYHDLVVDFRSLVIMRETGLPVIFDATHSVQQPSVGNQSGGQPRFIPALARAAAAVGIDGLFIETHPSPKDALSDAATQVALADFEAILLDVLQHWRPA
ncbi:MAG: 3-deoxy-8-phosphooctulonate synthase [Candidatus Kapabacteria bacterium]|nr:3-deoxy-8-phosphooctulonate synthase [Candidatus Kapabacteria bacterium]